MRNAAIPSYTGLRLCPAPGPGDLRLRSADSNFIQGDIVVRKSAFAVPAVALLVVLLAVIAAAQMPPNLTPFTADMQYTAARAGSRMEGMSGKIYMAPPHMRMDMEGGRRGGAIMITNMATQTSDMLMPQQHMYMEFKADQARMHRPGMAPSIKPFKDPSNPCAYDEGATCKNLGVESVNGRSADHWQITDKDGKVANVWIDQKIHFPIKTVTEDGSWQLTNIKEGEPSASLFEIPSDYHKMDMGSMMQGMRPPQE